MMEPAPKLDSDLEVALAAQVARGEFATVEDARADLLRSLDEALAEEEACGGVDAELVFARLHDRYAASPRAAE